MNGSKKTYLILFVGYSAAALLLFFFSYTQVDLNLTLSKVSLWQSIQKSFQYIGFYERSLATGWYIAVLIFFYLFYFTIVRLCQRRVIDQRALWKIIVGVTLVLVLSYPAFSYDMFNYMFTAKTVLVYHKNPYTVIPLQFAGLDNWIYFMRWVHLPSAYTPLWIALTLPPYLFGFGYFLLIMWNIKLLVAFSYLVAAWCIEKILLTVEKQHATVGLAMFALNPLVIIESLVSAHNDMVMMAIATIAILFSIKKHTFLSWFTVSVSIALKLMTLFLIPAFFLRWNRIAALAGMSVGFILVLFQREVLPWYFLWIMPFVALLPSSTTVFILSSGVSMGLLLRYAPYLYYGHWNDPVPFMKSIVTVAPIVFSIAIILCTPKLRAHVFDYFCRSRS